MVAGVHFAQHLCVVALGFGIDGTKHPPALVEGDTENATMVRRLLVGLRERGLDVTKPTLFVLDGAKALSTSVKAVFDHPVIARCEEHKATIVEHRMRAAYRNPDPLATNRPHDQCGYHELTENGGQDGSVEAQARFKKNCGGAEPGCRAGREHHGSVRNCRRPRSAPRGTI